jgi:transposase
MFEKKNGTVIGRPKGGKNARYSPKDKKAHLDAYYESNLPHRTYARINGIPDGTFRKWIANYEKYGIDGLKSKTGKCGSGNPYAALHIKKNLTEIERLRLELAKKEVECERLKKGYSVKGVGRRKEYVTINKKNSK